MVAPLVDVYETVDRASLAVELAERVPGATVLVQVRPEGPDAAGQGRLCDRRRPGAGRPLPRTGACSRPGLMTVGPTEGGPAAARPGFRAVRALVDRLGLVRVLDGHDRRPRGGRRGGLDAGARGQCAVRCPPCAVIIFAVPRPPASCRVGLACDPQEERECQSGRGPWTISDSGPMMRTTTTTWLPSPSRAQSRAGQPRYDEPATRAVAPRATTTSTARSAPFPPDPASPAATSSPSVGARCQRPTTPACIRARATPLVHQPRREEARR